MTNQLYYGDNLRVLREEIGDETEVHGTPKDAASAEALALQDRYQFQWWALSLVDARPAQDKKKGKDTGIDGLIRFLERESAYRFSPSKTSYRAAPPPSTRA